MNEQASLLFSLRCHYCGAEPGNVPKPSGNGELVYSGIDRVDSTVGYEADNCVPCCIQCNMAKGRMTEEEFLDWVRRVFHHRELSLWLS